MRHNKHLNPPTQGWCILIQSLHFFPWERLSDLSHSVFKLATVRVAHFVYMNPSFCDRCKMVAGLISRVISIVDSSFSPSTSISAMSNLHFNGRVQSVERCLWLAIGMKYLALYRRWLYCKAMEFERKLES